MTCWLAARPMTPAYLRYSRKQKGCNRQMLSLRVSWLFLQGVPMSLFRQVQAAEREEKRRKKEGARAQARVSAAQVKVDGAQQRLNAALSKLDEAQADP